MTRKKTIITAAATAAVAIISLALVVGSPVATGIRNIFNAPTLPATKAGFKDIRVGNDKIAKIYIGSTLYWEREVDIDIQTITAATCPTTRTRVRDARDGATYWVRKIGSLCWMETNLAYAGGGTNTYGDVTPAITENNSTSGVSYTSAIRSTPTGSNRTTGTTDPSTATSGTGQYGYLYNWCAAMNSQSAACQNSAATQPNQGVNGGTSSTLYNICPKNWRLPTGGSSGGEFKSLVASLGWTSGAPTPLFTNGLFMYSGRWGLGFSHQGFFGYYWSATTSPLNANNAYILTFTALSVYTDANENKDYGFAIRCVAP